MKQKEGLKKKTFEEREHQAYHDLAKFIYWYANHNEVKGHWLLNKEDLAAELFYVLAKVLPIYADKPYDEFLTLARTSMNNAVATLKYKALLTHRKLQYDSASLDEIQDMQDDDATDSAGYVAFADKFGNSTMSSMSDYASYETIDPAIYLQRAEELKTLLAQLSEFDKRVVNAVLGNNDRVRLYIDIQRKRKDWVYANPSVITITPYIVARALNEDVKAVKLAYKRIQKLFLC